MSILKLCLPFLIAVTSCTLEHLARNATAARRETPEESQAEPQHCVNALYALHSNEHDSLSAEGSLEQHIDRHKDADDKDLDNGAPEAPEEPAAEKLAHVYRVAILDLNLALSGDGDSTLLGHGRCVDAIDIECVLRIRAAVAVHALADDEYKVQYQ